MVEVIDTDYQEEIVLLPHNRSTEDSMLLKGRGSYTFMQIVKVKEKLEHSKKAEIMGTQILEK